MKKITKLIGHILTKNNIKIFLLMFIFFWFFVWKSFAQNMSFECSDTVCKMTNGINFLISILSWWWVVLATLAGKLMTNDLVYGTFLNLDSSLWNLWNIMKNFANFTLWFILLFSIVKNLIGIGKKDANPLTDSLKVVKNVLLAGVLVQISWFALWLIFDLSTIAVSAVGSLPSQFLSSSQDFEGTMKRLIKSKQKNIVVDFTQANIVSVQNTWNMTDDELKNFLDTITPSADSVVGPLIFLWWSIFDLFDMSDTSYNTSGEDSWSNLFLTIGINWFVLFSFSVILALMTLFNLFRLITLRVVIPLSPFIVLLHVFDPNHKIMDGKWKSFLGKITNLSNIVKLIFKPVYIVLMLSVVLIVMVLLKWLIGANNVNLSTTTQENIVIKSQKVWEADATAYNSSLGLDWIVDFSMDGMKHSVVNLMIYIFGLILMVMLMKACISSDTWISFIDDRVNNASKFIWWEKWKFGWLLGTAGVVPIWGGQKVWLWTFSNFVNDKIINDSASLSRTLWIDANAQNDLVEDRFGLWWSFDRLRNITKDEDRENWINYAVSIWKNKKYTFNEFFANTDFQTQLKLWNEKSGRSKDKKIDVDHLKSARDNPNLESGEQEAEKAPEQENKQ